MALRTVDIYEVEWGTYCLVERPNAEYGYKVTPEFIARYKLVQEMWRNMNHDLAQMYHKNPEPQECVELKVPAFEALGELIEKELTS